MTVVSTTSLPTRVSADRSPTYAVLLAVAFVALYGGVIGQLIDAWSNNYLYSYGFAVPFISAYMVWTKWPELRATPWTPHYAIGLPVVVAGVTLLVTGVVGSINAFQQLSMIVTLVGLALVVFGAPIFKAFWFPIFYLLLMLPLWDQPISRLQIPSQLLSARIAVGMLRAIDVPVVREATHIVLPNLTLEVLRECSGVNQLIVVFAMALPAAYLFLTGLWRRAALIVFALVIAYLSNGFRIALIGVLAQRGYQEATRGTLHLVQGLLVSGIGYLLIGVVLSWLARGTGAKSQPSSPATRDTARIRRPWLEGCTLAALVTATAFLAAFRPTPVALAKDLGTLPLQFGEWVMDPALRSASDDLVLPVMDDQIVRNYRNSSGERVQLFVGYYRHQQAGKELSNAAVRELHAGAERFALMPSAEDDRFVRARHTDGRGVIFWYDVNGRIVDNLYAAKAYTVWDAITRRRTNIALVVVQWETGRPNDSRAAQESAIGFIRAVLPSLRRSFPS